MCLKINYEVTDNFRNKNKNKKQIIVWKVVKKKQDRYYSPVFHNLIPVEGKFRSNRCSKVILEHEKYWQTVEKGIHVYKNRQEARKSWIRGNGIIDDKRILKCCVNIKDFVAAGLEGELVFTQITILPQRKKGH